MSISVLGSVVQVDPNADEGDALVQKLAQNLFNNIKSKLLCSEDQGKQNKNTPPHEEGSEN